MACALSQQCKSYFSWTAVHSLSRFRVDLVTDPVRRGGRPAPRERFVGSLQSWSVSRCSHVKSHTVYRLICAAQIPAYQIRNDTFDFEAFSALWSQTCSLDGPLWRARSATYSQCRFVLT